MEWAAEDSLIEVLNVRIIQDDYTIWKDLRFYILSILFAGVGFLLILATVLDIINDDERRKWSKYFIYRVLNSFSVIGNLKIIFSLNVGDDTLAPIHGLKFISMMWIILLHSCLHMYTTASNKKFRDKAEQDLLFQTLSNGTYGVDTFFTLSGVLVSFLFFRTTSKYSIKKLVGVSGVFGQIFLYLGMLAYRIMRLSLPYMIIVVLSGLLNNIAVHNSPFTTSSRDYINCVNYWWRNALFINTFYSSKDMCMVWSWYLANDTQFYVIGVLLLIIALKYRLIAIILGALCLISCWLTTAFISYQNHHVIDVKDPFSHYDELYDKPWTRVGPYFIGMATGWILFNINCQLKISKSLNISIWICAFTSMIFVIYGPLYLPEGPISGALYMALSHSLWSMGVAWILTACVTKNGFWINNLLSWKYMYPLSRLSYCAYLVHPLVMREVVLNSDIPVFLSIQMVAAFYFGNLILSLIFAGILSLAFESPMVAILRLGHPMRRSD